MKRDGCYRSASARVFVGLGLVVSLISVNAPSAGATTEPQPGPVPTVNEPQSMGLPVAPERSGASVSTSAELASLATDPTPAPAKWDLLSVGNWFRAHVGGHDDGAKLPKLAWNKTRAATAKNHIDYLKYLRSIGSDYCGHYDDPKHPGDRFGDREHNVLFCGVTNLASATEGWLATPLHGQGFLDPTVVSVGGASNSAGSAAGFEWNWDIETTQPYVFPAPNGVMPLINWWGAEVPNPSANCPPLAGQVNGEPIMVFMPQSALSGPQTGEWVNYVYRGHELRSSNGTVIPSCYMTWDETLTAGEEVGTDGYIFPRRGFANGGRYTASVRLAPVIDGKPVAEEFNLQWSFNVVDYRYPSATKAEVLPDGRVRMTWNPPTQPNQEPSAFVEYTTDGGKTTETIEVNYSVYDGRVTLDGIPLGVKVRLRTSADSPWSNEVRIPVTVTPLAPARLADTRPGFKTVDGRVAGVGRIGDVGILRVPVRGRGGVPVGAKAVLVNLTPVGGDDPGYVTAWSCDGQEPFASSANFSPIDGANPNMALVPLNSKGELCLFVSRSTHLVLDVTGFVGVGTGAELASVAPARLADTRPGFKTADGRIAGTGRLRAGSVLKVPVSGRAGVPDGAKAAMVNLTPVGGDGAGYVTAWSCDGKRPLASSANFAAFDGANPNMALVPLNAKGELCLFVSRATDLAVDVTGFVGDGSASELASVQTARLADTRKGFPTADDRVAGVGRMRADSVLRVPVAGRVGVPTGAKAAMVNVTPVGGEGAGFVTAWSCDGKRPLASSANFAAVDGANPNLALVPLNAKGELCLYASRSTDLVVDITGFVVPT